MLNMLIAIMGDSFDKVIENREINSPRMRLEILIDISAMLKSKEQPHPNPNMIVLKPEATDDDEDGDDWEGTIRRLTKVVERQARYINIRLGAKCDKLLQTFEDFTKKDIIQDRSLKAYIADAVKVQSEKVLTHVDAKIDARIDSLENKLDAVLANFN